MNLFEYVSKMKETGSPAGLIGVLLLCLFLIIIIFKMLFGMGRGTWRQLILTGSSLISAIISCTIATLFTNSIIGSTDTSFIESIVGLLDSFVPEIAQLLNNMLLSLDPRVFETIMLIPATLGLGPMLAGACFIIINIIFSIIRSIVHKVVRIKKAETNPDRLGGAIGAAVEAIICVIMISLPMTGIIGIVDQAYATDDYGDQNTEQSSFYSESILPFTENPVHGFLSALGADAAADSIATVNIDGNSVNMRKEILSISKTVIFEIPSLTDIDFNSPDEDAKKALSNIVEGVCDSPFITNIIIGSLKNASSFIELDFIPSEDAGEFGELIDDIIGYIEGISVDTMREDLRTALDLYFVISDSGAFKSMSEGEGDLLTILQEQRKNGDDTLSKVIRILQNNERTSMLVKSLTEALISSLSTNIETNDGTTVTVTYDALKESMNEVLTVKPEAYETPEEYMEALTETLDNTLTEHGIKLEIEIVESIAEYIDGMEFSSDKMTDSEFSEVLLHYYDAYLEFIETGDIPGEFDDFIPDGN